jgi:hypothetical protein
MPHKDPETAKAYRRAYYERTYVRKPQRNIKTAEERAASVRKASATYRQRHPARVAAERSNRYNANRLHLLMYKGFVYLANKDALDEAYIKGLLTGKTAIKFADVPAPLVAAKTEQLKIKRYLHEQRRPTS